MTSIGEPTDQDKKFINDLFNELAGIFTAWKNAFDGAEGIRVAKRNWMAGLIDSGINKMDQIQNGLRKARKSDNPFMPSVGQFIKWCNVDSEELGLPSLNEVINEILDRRRLGFGEPPKEYSSGFIFSLTRDKGFDSYYLSGLHTEKAIKYMKPIYDKYLKRAVAGEIFEIPIMIEDKKDRPVTRKECHEFAKQHLDELKKAVK